jgi:hypothetical protein
MDLTFYSSSCREARRERITSGRSSENVVLERAGAAIDSSPHVVHANGGWMSVGVVLQCCWTVNVSLVCCQTTQWCGLIGLLYKWNIAATIFEWIWGDPGLGGDYRIQIDNAFFLSRLYFSRSSPPLPVRLLTATGNSLCSGVETGPAGIPPSCTMQNAAKLNDSACHLTRWTNQA